MTIKLAQTSPATPLDLAEKIAPGIAAPALSKRLRNWAPTLTIVAIVCFCIWDLDVDVSRLFTWSDVATRMLSGLLHPNPGGHTAEIIHGLIETIAMAIAGTFLAVGLALPLGAAGSKAVISNRFIHAVIRFFYDILRAIPTLVWAIIIIRAVGLGPVAGVVAIGLAESPYLAKLYAEILENANPRPIAALKASGASHWQALRLGLVPQILANYAGLALFFLEINMRAAAALGVVGAGGLGQLLEERIGYAAFDQAAFIIIVLLVMVAIFDAISARLRQAILGDEKISWR